MAASGPGPVSAAVQYALAPAARYVALVASRSPQGTAAQLLARPDVDATLRDALEQARQAADGAVRAQWAGSPPDADLLNALLADIARQYDALPRLRTLIRAAHEAAEKAGRPAAVRRAVLRFARAAALRSALSVSVAETAAAAVRALAEGRLREASGEAVSKRWEARPGCCHWCAGLHGTVIGLGESFLPYLAGPADLAGHGRLTQPPEPYRGLLDYPPLHPRCRCRIVIVRAGSQPAPGLPPAGKPAFTAAQVRAMPEEKYSGLVAFITAAVHELGQVLRKLVSRS